MLGNLLNRKKERKRTKLEAAQLRINALTRSLHDAAHRLAKLHSTFGNGNNWAMQDAHVDECKLIIGGCQTHHPSFVWVGEVTPAEMFDGLLEQPSEESANASAEHATNNGPAPTTENVAA